MCLPLQRDWHLCVERLGYVRRERQFECVEGAMWGVGLCVYGESVLCVCVWRLVCVHVSLCVCACVSVCVCMCREGCVQRDCQGCVSGGRAGDVCVKGGMGVCVCIYVCGEWNVSV